MNSVASDILKQFRLKPDAFEQSAETPGVWTGPVPGAKASEVWSSLQIAFDRSGLWPIIRGEPSELDAEPVDAPSILKAAPKGNLDAVLSSELKKRRNMLIEVGGLKATATADVHAIAAAADAANFFSFGGRRSGDREPWPEQPPETQSKPGFHSLSRPGSKTTFKTVMMSLIPLRHPFEAPAYLGFGGWNECPPPKVHVAALREWFSQYGAVPAAMTSSVLECVVSRLPQDEAASMSLAAEQWLFCDDIVSQGTQSVRRLAIELWRSPKWYFWWD